MFPDDPRYDLLATPPDAVRPREWWVGRLAVAAAAALAVAALAHSGLLSRDAATVHPREHVGPAPEAVAPFTSGPSVVVQIGRDLVRYDKHGATAVARLPSEFSASDQLFAVDDAGYPPLMFGLSERNLFRIDARTGRTVASVGIVEKVIGHGPGHGELVVQVDSGHGPHAVVIEAATSDVVDRDPFPAFDGSEGWVARATISVFAAPGLVVTREMADGQEEAAIIWSRRGPPVPVGKASSPLQRIGTLGRLLGVADDWVLFLSGSCPSSSCVLKVLSFTKDGAMSTRVAAPRGWSFVAGQVGGEFHEALVTVVDLHNPEVHALARVVRGGGDALLLRGSLGLDPSAGLVAEPGGAVYFVQGRSGDDRTFARWSPVDSEHLSRLAVLPAPPLNVRLVCVCD